MRVAFFSLAPVDFGPGDDDDPDLRRGLFTHRLRGLCEIPSLTFMRNHHHLSINSCYGHALEKWLRVWAWPGSKGFSCCGCFGGSSLLRLRSRSILNAAKVGCSVPGRCEMDVIAAREFFFSNAKTRGQGKMKKKGEGVLWTRKARWLVCFRGL